MNPISAIYHRLTAPQRIRAAIMADARNDSEELERLKVTCPKRSFLITDPDYAETMELINYASVVREFYVAINCLHWRCLCGGSDCEASKSYYASQVVSSDEAWRRFADSLGVTSDDLNAATASRCELIAFMADGFADHHQPEESAVAELLEELKAHLPAT